MNIQQQKDFIREKCIEANPYIKDLTFGCRGIWHMPESETAKAKDLSATIIKLWPERLISILTDKPIDGSAKNITWHTATIPDSDFTVIGHKITLCNILNALGSFNPDIITCMTQSDGALVKGELASLFCDWNFNQDNLDFQKLETIESIYKLLK